MNIINLSEQQRVERAIQELKEKNNNRLDIPQGIINNLKKLEEHGRANNINLHLQFIQYLLVNHTQDNYTEARELIITYLKRAKEGTLRELLCNSFYLGEVIYYYNL